jgi:uncharacterized protein YkwD
VKFLWHLLFIPHEKNNHRALLLQPAFLSFFIFLYLLNQSFLRTISLVKPGVLGYSSEITSQQIYDLTNDQRQKAGLPLLHYNPTLSESATKKAQDMFKNNYWAHNSPSGTTPWDFFKAVGYQYSVAGENLAKDFYDNDSVMKAWMNSPTHKANIVSPKYQEIGIGVANGILNGVKTTLVVQHFGTPLDPSLISINTPEEKAYVEHTSVVSPVLASTAKQNTEFLVNPQNISKGLSLFLFALIIGVLFVDSYITLKNQTHRLSGSATGHIGFLMIIFLLIIFTRQGVIF